MTEKTVTDDNIEDVTVSVVIPYSESYTPREMLTEAIESIESQIGVDTDVIVIEDSDERGPAWARNVGLDRAETRYVAFLDADDLWEETKLVKQLRLMKETGAGMCVDGEQSYSPLEFAGALLTAETFGLTSSILIDTEKVDVRFDESLERREDHLYMIEAAAERGICFSADTFIARKNEEGLSQHVDSSPEQIDEFFEKVVDRVPEVERFKSPYYQNSYIYLGRLRHFDKEYRTAIRYYLKALRYGPNIKAVGAIGLTVLMLLYEYPLRPIRKHVTSSSVHE
jgi:glycosyltransferase involved in cell wall biosynthesis